MRNTFGALRFDLWFFKLSRWRYARKKWHFGGWRRHSTGTRRRIVTVMRGGWRGTVTILAGRWWGTVSVVDRRITVVGRIAHGRRAVMGERGRMPSARFTARSSARAWGPFSTLARPSLWVALDVMRPTSSCRVRTTGVRWCQTAEASFAQWWTLTFRLRSTLNRS